MIKISFLLSFLATSSYALTAKLPISAPEVLLEINGRIYPKDSIPTECPQILKGEVCKKESYGMFHVVSKKEDDIIYSKAIFSDAEGPEVIEETWEKGGLIKKGKLENRQLGVVGELEVIGGKIKLKRTKGTEIKTDEIDSEPNLVMPSTLMSYLRPRFDQILKGNEVQIKMAVLDRMDAFTFNIKKYKEWTSPDGEKMIGLKMIPNSIIVQVAVDPIYFHIKASTGELVAFEGRSSLRRKVKGDYKDLDVYTSYDPYVHNAFKRNLLETCGAGQVLNQDAKCMINGEVIPEQPASSSKK